MPSVIQQKENSCKYNLIKIDVYLETFRVNYCMKTLILIKKRFDVMKKILFGILFATALLSCNAQNNTDKLIARNQTIDSTKVLVPDALHAKISRIVATILQRLDYKKIDLNDSLSSVIFDNYIKTWDGNKLYFLQSDIDEFEKDRNNFDDYLRAGDLSVPFKIFNRYKIRLGERVVSNLRLLKSEFDYTKNENIHPSRKKAMWAKTTAELDELWRKRLKNDALNAKLNGDKWEKISSTLSKRFKYFHKTILKYDDEDVFQIYMNAFAEAVDPHTSYFSPITAENFGINMSLSLEGIGAQLTSKNDYTTIVRIIPGGPAFKSKKLHENDRIIAAAQGDDGEFVDFVGWRLDDVIQLIRGKKGTVVRLKIEKADADPNLPPIILRLVRDKIKLEEQAAKSKTIKVEDNGRKFHIGVIDVPGFYVDFKGKQKGDKNYKSTTRDVKNLLLKLEKEKVDGVIIDLRSNGGGSLQEAIQMTGLFIKDGPVVQVRNSNGKIDVGTDNDPSEIYKGPLAVLVNRYSASASEIFSAAIQDYGRGLIIGSQSFGKGTVQNLIDLKRFMPSSREKLGEVKLTIAKFYRVNGSSTQRKGVTPDVKFPSALPADEFGERSYKSALPWDTIRSSDFQKAGNLDPFIPRLIKKHNERIAEDEEFQNYIDDVSEMIKLRKKNSYSLNYEIRKAEREKAEKKKKERDAAKGKDSEIKVTGDEEVKTTVKKTDDVLLNEAGNVLSDYIILKVG